MLAIILTFPGELVPLSHHYSKSYYAIIANASRAVKVLTTQLGLEASKLCQYQTLSVCFHKSTPKLGLPLSIVKIKVRGAGGGGGVKIRNH